MIVGVSVGPALRVGVPAGKVVAGGVIVFAISVRAATSAVSRLTGFCPLGWKTASLGGLKK